MSMLDLELIRKHAEAAENVYVSTVNEAGFPVTRVMFNLHNPGRFPKQAAFIAGLNEGFRIYLATNAGSSKVAQVRRTPLMSVYYHVHGSWQGMLLAGEAEIVSDVEIKRGIWQDEWSVYYEGGAEGDDYTLLRLRPVFAELYHDLTKETLTFEEVESADRA